jgi:ankyrin repeat protein
MDIVDAAVNSGAGIDAKDNDGATALMLAVKPPKPSIINKLLQKGADTTGITSEDWIRVYGSPGTNINIVELREDSEGKVVQLLTLKKLQHAILNPVENQRRLL